MTYRVYLKSKAGMWARYSGYVDVNAGDERDAEFAAKAKLRRTSFPDRPMDGWITERIECRGSA
jgi:hypothetical protein